MIQLYDPKVKRISAKAYRRMKINKALDKMNTEQTNKVMQFAEMISQQHHKRGYKK